MRVSAALALTIALFTPPTFAQQWGSAREIPAEQSMIDIKLTGWGKSSIRRASTNAGGDNNIHMEVINSSITASAQGYYAVVVVHEAPNQTTWNRDTIQNIANRFFSENQPVLGEYFDVDHGPADFRAIPVAVTGKDGKKNNCAAYRAYWRSYSALGFICAANGAALAPETVKTFITHIAYRGELTPKDEGTLPTP
ncbi:hypothetical protein [Elstera cyanobacteriorum]|uniref:hypothetical protein n=1 Tax=Elstera cyanobacteriorum TaxID=2022747 RepID=UPI002355A981|nr:hypothetical protein [Elstera cyanobacteriorum]MCK6444650.1 hypothetical protein [Elstera cyanobacteriorum]